MALVLIIDGFGLVCFAFKRHFRKEVDTEDKDILVWVQG
jgi:hypothetical protein